MRLSQRHDQVSPERLLAGAAGGAQSARAGGAEEVAARCVRLIGLALRGPAGLVTAVASFAAGAVVGGRGGLAIASVYATVMSTYCLLNFLQCRETHCGVPGPGFYLTALR